MTMIKFRGIPLEDTSDIDGVEFDGTFVYGNYVKYGDSAVIVGDALEVGEDRFWPSWWVPVSTKTVEQFTGLTDVNGKDIYVGDIIEAPIKDYAQANKHLVKNICETHVWVKESDSYYAISKMEIVGNVHENPKLLEE